MRKLCFIFFLFACFHVIAQDEKSDTGSTEVTDDGGITDATDAHWLQGSGDDVYRSAGKVAIGTSGTPLGKLHIEAGNSAGLILNTDDEGPWAFRLRNLTASHRGLEIFQRDDGRVLMANNYPNTTMTLSGDGMVGIGATDPVANLDVDGTIRTAPQSTATCDSSLKGSIYYDLQDDYFYGCNGTSWVRLDDTGSGVGGGTAISTNSTLNVPGTFTDINDAMDYLSDITILPGVTVTIQVADGTYTNQPTINLNHPQGNQIEVLGNTTDESMVELQFVTDARGFQVSEGHQIKLIDGFTLVGYQETGSGITVTDSSRVKCGEAIHIKDFDRGIIISSTSSIFANSILVEDCGVHGIDVAFSAHGDFTGATTQNNGNSGLSVSWGSSVVFNDGTSTGNINGASVSHNGAFRALNSDLTGNSTASIYDLNGGVYKTQ